MLTLIVILFIISKLSKKPIFPPFEMLMQSYSIKFSKAKR